MFVKLYHQKFYRVHNKSANVSFDFHRILENIDRTFIEKDRTDIFRLLITKNMLTTRVNAIVIKRPSVIAELWCRDSFIVHPFHKAIIDVAR